MLGKKCTPLIIDHFFMRCEIRCVLDLFNINPNKLEQNVIKWTVSPKKINWKSSSNDITIQVTSDEKVKAETYLEKFSKIGNYNWECCQWKTQSFYSLLKPKKQKKIKNKIQRKTQEVKERKKEKGLVGDSQAVAEW